MSTFDSIAVAPQPFSRRGNILLLLLFAMFAMGATSLYLSAGSDSVQADIPLLTASFLYLMGISQVGVVFCAMTRLVKAQWAKPYYRLAELSTLAFSPFAIGGFLLLYFYARNDLFYWLSPGPDAHLSAWLNSDWLLARNLLGLFLFYGLSAFYAMKGIQADRAAEQGASVQQLRDIESRIYLFSPIVVLGFVLCNTFFAWDFAMMLIPHWHSTVFPIYYWFGSVFAGSAAMIVFPAVLGRTEQGAHHFGPDQVRFLGMLVTAFTLMWLYFFWAQFFVIWFGNLPHEAEPLWRQMFGHYGPYFWTMMAGCFFVPLASLLFAVVKRSLFAMCLLAIGINLGIWISKYLMVVPVFSPDNRPFTQWPDISIALGLLAGFLAVLILLCRRFPMYARWEMSVKPIRRFPTA
jgi:hypothetical protein